jgi:hypothetical protein
MLKASSTLNTTSKSRFEMTFYLEVLSLIDLGAIGPEVMKGCVPIPRTNPAVRSIRREWDSIWPRFGSASFLRNRGARDAGRTEQVAGKRDQGHTLMTSEWRPPAVVFISSFFNHSSLQAYRSQAVSYRGGLGAQGL